MRRIVPALCLALAGASGAQAAERLVAAPPPGQAWTLAFQTANGEELLHEHLPVGQTLEGYKEILSIRRMPKLPGVPPALLLQATFASLPRACGNVRTNGPTEAKEEGRPVAYGQAYCNRQNGKDYGVHLFFKVIEGERHLFVINHDFRVPPSDVAGVTQFPKGAEAEALAFMKNQGAAAEHLTSGVRLCPDESKEALCATPPQGADVIG